ncbi:chromosome segregation protein SMC [Sporolactobacillus laevolacticus]|uniref:Chromosome partition protein Smc n=1 Tax=Sporolactobacillus laevolacticus DSM 442 TaxID=1395513 RepID=V6IZX2_9BACL|nr:chromosome segregation protein SMC [Sporolactobacillus laevolacticus]EST13092.1 chromosome segregation protein SMC [Sporolactobacillus laevolacticus DSM 442]
MFLKRLDVSGFKSFANKTSVEFVPGVTAVVGPNGSGKSNITESIRWVLGEQSAKSLRGSKMEDIIFSGSDAKKAVNMAEVTLILDNSDRYIPMDFSEISVTRRVFRSGESEFQLNKQSCRLKDIVDLFMDSGLGKEAYSVIGQGKIDEILNSKAEDKRRIFEEASGVLKYKLRKQAAEKQLNESEDSLNRVEDILHELDARLGPLEQQASIAKDYLQKKGELEEVDIALLAHDIDELHSQWEETKKSVESLSTKKVALAEAIEKLDGNYRSNRSLLEELDHTIETMQTEWAESTENLEKLLGRKQVLTERNKHAHNNAEELKDRISRLEEQLQKERQLLEQTSSGYRSEKETLADFQRKLAKKQTEFSSFEQNLDDRIERLKAEYIEVLNQQAAMRNERRYLSDQDKSLSAKKNRIQANTEEIKTLAEEAGKRKEALEKQLNKIGAEGKKLQTQHDMFRSRLEEERTRYTKEKEAVDKISNYIEQARSRKEMLEALKEDYAGYYQGVKVILKNRKHLPGIHGAVAELIHVDKKYGTAVETALGGSSQHLVVSDESAGRKAIQFLRQHQAGRATFLPISVIKSKVIQPAERSRIQGQPAFVGTGADLVSYDPRYQQIVEFLLGAVIIARDLEGANQLAKQVHYRYRVVTLDGDVVAPGGAMTGGSVKQHQASLIGRGAEIDELTAQIKEMQAKREQLQADFSKLKNQIAADELETESVRKALQAALEQFRQVESEKRDAETEEKAGLEKYHLLSRENGDFEAEQTKIAERLRDIDASVSANAKKGEELTAQIGKLTKNRQDIDSSKQALQSEITSLKVRMAEQSQIVTHLEEKESQSKTRVGELNASIEALRSSASGIDSEIESQHEHTQKIDQQIEEAQSKKDALMNALMNKRETRRERHSALASNESNLSKRRTELNEVSSVFQEKNVVLGRMDVQLDHLLDTLREDYELTIEAARENYQLTIEVPEARKKVKLIKLAIEELGSVNLGAIEEFDTVLEREQFLSAQRADLMKARETLNHVMSEMDQVVEQRFTETFNKIRQQFQIVFRELFGGGRADLQLIEPADMLTSGVDILAEPPGKKLQRLSLLSGGERALTAIALLFAILKVRPVPFCVLDEVEAALDDANVDRYAAFLKKFSMDTQFIVVTHRHGTMERSDVLYGVTMQESGVSRLVSVRLEETDELLTAGNG